MKEPDSGPHEAPSGSGYDYKREKLYAEAMLRRLCLGTEIIGVYWSGFPDVITLYIDDSIFADKRTRSQYAFYQKLRPGESWLMIEHKWAVLDRMPPAAVEDEQAIADALPETITYEHLGQLASLHDDPIIGLRLGVSVGHLMLEFNSGRCLFIHGDHEMYEPWEIRVVPPRDFNTRRQWLLVVTPGSEFAIWTPDDFDPNFDADWRRPQE